MSRVAVALLTAVALIGFLIGMLLSAGCAHIVGPPVPLPPGVPICDPALPKPMTIDGCETSTSNGLPCAKCKGAKGCIVDSMRVWCISTDFCLEDKACGY